MAAVLEYIYKYTSNFDYSRLDWGFDIAFSQEPSLQINPDTEVKQRKVTELFSMEQLVQEIHN